MSVIIYYLPGWAGRLNTGLGQALSDSGYEVAGRDTFVDFKNVLFADQVELVKQDLLCHFWTDDSFVIANSYGAYRFLHAQVQLPPFPGKVLLLSPILGEFNDDSTSRGFIPPRAGKLLKLAREGVYPSPARCAIHVGSEDWQSQPDVVVEFGKLTGIAVTVAEGRGHDLGKDYVALLLDRLRDV